MLLTLTTARRPATDLGFLLHKHPDRVQTFELPFGSAHVVHPEFSDARCTAALLLEVDPIGLVRGRSGKRGGEVDGLLTQYVNDRSYAAPSFLSVAISRVFGSALKAHCKTRPELVDVELPPTASVAALHGEPSRERSAGNTSIAAERPPGRRRIGCAAAVVSSFMDLRWSRLSAVVIMLACAPSVAAADAVRVLDPLPEAPLPEALLPHQFDDPAVATSARLLAAADGMSQHGPWTHRLCLGDERAVAHVLAGLEEAAANGALEKAEVDWAYREIVRGCPDRGPDEAHARWLSRAARDAKTAGARALLFDALASVHPLDEPELFEQEAPDDALIAFHRRRSGDSANAYSARLAALVERRLADGDERGLRNAAEALARSSDVRAVETFRRLLDRRPPTELADALWRPLRASPHADGFALFQSHCAPRREQANEAWIASGPRDVRGSPYRWGDPCSRETFPSLPSASGSADASSQEHVPAPARCQPLPWYEAVPASPASETCFDLPTTRGTQFAGDAQLLRTLIRVVRPHLDSVAFAERWPAVDAVSLERGQIEHTIFVNGDGVLVRVPPDETGAPDAAVAATITRQLEEALDGERWIDVEHDGVRRRFAFGPCGAPWCAQAMLDIANALLEGNRAPVRLTRDSSEPHVLRIRVEGTERLAR
jgi:hypothetical protein